MTADNVFSEARFLINDIATEDANRRHPLRDMVKFFNNAMQDLLTRRPELALADAGTLTAYTEITTSTYNTQALPVNEDYRKALAHHIAHQIFQLDANDEHNAEQAAAHLGLYMSMI